MLIIVALFGVVIGIAQATIVSLTIKAGEEVTQPINLIAEDRVLIQYKFVQGNATAIQFSISFPNGTNRDFKTSGDFSHSFICDNEGEYLLHFVNTDQKEDVRLTLDYEIQHYIFGIPQMLFMVILIAIISVVGVAIFIGLSPRP
jgi:hypothetical protein